MVTSAAAIRLIANKVRITPVDVAMADPLEEPTMPSVTRSAMKMNQKTRRSQGVRLSNTANASGLRRSAFSLAALAA